MEETYLVGICKIAGRAGRLDDIIMSIIVLFKLNHCMHVREAIKLFFKEVSQNFIFFTDKESKKKKKLSSIMSTGRRMQNQTKLCLTLLLTYLMETVVEGPFGLLPASQDGLHLNKTQNSYFQTGHKSYSLHL